MTKNSIFNSRDTEIRSKERLSRSNSIPENELGVFELSIISTINEFNAIVSGQNIEQIGNAITNLSQLINKEGVILSNSIFLNPQFLQNLELLLQNPQLSILTCQLISGILFHTKDFGVSIAHLIEPILNLFIQNIQNPGIQIIVNALCNLSSHLQLHLDFKDDYYDKTKVHPLKTIARNIGAIIQCTQNGFQISLSYLLFIRHIANFNMPTDEESYAMFCQYLISLLTNEQVTANPQFMKIVLWTLTDNLGHFLLNEKEKESDSKLVTDEFIHFLIELMQSNDFIYAEPIFHFLLEVLHVDYLSHDLGQTELIPPYDFGIPTIFQMCINGQDESIKFEALSFIGILTKVYPKYMVENGLLDFINTASESDLSYQIQIQLHAIVCVLLTRFDFSYLDADQLLRLFQLITGNLVSGNEKIEYLTTNTLFLCKMSMASKGRSEEFNALLSASGASDFLEELQSTTQDERILTILEDFENAEEMGVSVTSVNQSYHEKVEEFQQFDSNEIAFNDEDEELYSKYINENPNDTDRDELEIPNENVPTKIRFVYNES